MLMNSSSAEQSVSLQGTTVHNECKGGACSSNSIVMKSSEGGYSQYDGGADGDSKMKSVEEAGGGALDSEREDDESSTSYPQIKANAQNDFQKAN